MPSASTTYQSRGMSFPLGENVRIGASSWRTTAYRRRVQWSFGGPV